VIADHHERLVEIEGAVSFRQTLSGSGHGVTFISIRIAGATLECGGEPLAGESDPRHEPVEQIGVVGVILRSLRKVPIGTGVSKAGPCFDS
jgi:hypothetical protein